MPARLAALLTLLALMVAPVRGQAAADPGVDPEWLVFVRIGTIEDANARQPAGVLSRLAAEGLVRAIGGEPTGDLAPVLESIGRAEPGAWSFLPGSDGTALWLKRLEAATPPAAGDEATGEWGAHRAAAAAAHDGREPAIEVGINLNALRRHLPQAFAPGRGSALLEALGLANGRVLGLHAYILAADSVPTRDPSLPRVGAAPEPYSGPPVLAIEATWTARSEPPGQVRHKSLTSFYWPSAQVGGGAPPGEPPALAATARLIWRSILDRGLDLYGSSLKESEVEAFATARERWMHDGRGAADQLLSRAEPWAALRVEKGASGMLVLRWRVRMRDAITAESARKALADALSPLGDFIAQSDADGRMWARPDHRWRRIQASWTILAPEAPVGRAVVEGTIQFSPEPSEK